MVFLAWLRCLRIADGDATCEHGTRARQARAGTKGPIAVLPEAVALLPARTQVLRLTVSRCRHVRLIPNEPSVVPAEEGRDAAVRVVRRPSHPEPFLSAQPADRGFTRDSARKALFAAGRVRAETPGMRCGHSGT